MKKLNNKGFTLIELLAVIVILIIVTAIAVPSISSSVERAKAKRNEEVSKNLEYAVEFYLSDYKSYRTSFYNGNCYIGINDLIKERYIMKDEVNTSFNDVIYNVGEKKINIIENANKVKCGG